MGVSPSPRRGRLIQSAVTVRLDGALHRVQLESESGPSSDSDKWSTESDWTWTAEPGHTDSFSSHPIHCEACGIWLKDPEQWNLHLLGRKHKKRCRELVQAAPYGVNPQPPE